MPRSAEACRIRFFPVCCATKTETAARGGSPVHPSILEGQVAPGSRLSMRDMVYDWLSSRKVAGPTTRASPVGELIRWLERMTVVSIG